MWFTVTFEESIDYFISISQTTVKVSINFGTGPYCIFMRLLVGPSTSNFMRKYVLCLLNTDLLFLHLRWLIENFKMLIKLCQWFSMRIGWVSPRQKVRLALVHHTMEQTMFAMQGTHNILSAAE